MRNGDPAAATAPAGSPSEPKAESKCTVGFIGIAAPIEGCSAKVFLVRALLIIRVSAYLHKITLFVEIRQLSPAQRLNTLLGLRSYLSKSWHCTSRFPVDRARSCLT